MKHTSRLRTLCLASLAAQSFADFAAILVDDGSTDGSGDGPRAMGCRSAGSHTGSGGTAGVYGDSGGGRALARVGKSLAGIWSVQG